MLNKQNLCVSLCALAMISCSKSSDKNASKTVLKDQRELTLEENKALINKSEEDKVDGLETVIEQMHRYPRLTLIMVPKGSVSHSIKNLVEGGGKLIYNPNQGEDNNDIPFYIAELTPDLINESDFISSLNLKAMSIDSEFKAHKTIETKMLDSNSVMPENNIPKDSVYVQDLSLGLDDLGEGTTVAVIDTGIDASHPAFGNRVVYWYDATEETQIELKEVKLSNNKFIELNENKINIEQLGLKKASKVYAAMMKESDFYAQLSPANKKNLGYLDINYNKTSDEFLVIAKKIDSELQVFFDVNGDHAITKKELEVKIDYNQTRKNNRDAGMISFPSRANIIKYPVLIEQIDDKVFLGLGKTSGMHGTHVAGIVAADDKEGQLVGVAPKADLMSLRVCSQISCTDSAIIKALYKTFYNGKVIPDVVNISLGSHEGKRKGVYSYLFDDLSAKFGTIFFVSASNSGPGFRSLNHIGNTGAVVMVGANVSSKTLSDQYNLPSSEMTQDENMLFFSSLGPSYTSEMKPNIVAPGAAISTVLTAEGYMSQANGTSMSSPLAAGTMAAILSDIKSTNKDSLKTISKLRKKNLKGSESAQGSLLPYVYAMRDALQSTATIQENVSMAQQGYGLIHAPSAKNKLEELLYTIENEDKTYFEVVLNDYKESYERKSVSKLKKFSLSLGKDAERTKESEASIRAAGIDIELAKVEILKNDGTVSLASDATDYFSVIEQGNANEKSLNAHVSFSNRRRNSFFSARYLENMTDGYTYIAHYKVNHKGLNVQNILDVVHRPVVMKKQDIFLPSISASLTQTKKGFAAKDVEIGVNTFHRYPIQVTKKMSHLEIKAGIDHDFTGLVYVQLYNPSGKEAAFKYAMRNPVTNLEMLNMKVSTFSKDVIQEGIWELTISTSSSTWSSSSKYDLLIESNSFGFTKSSYALSAGEQKIIPAHMSGKKASKAMLLKAVKAKTETVKVKSGHVSFHPLELNGAIQFELGIIDTKNYWGNISPSLYTKNGDSFEKIETVFSKQSPEGMFFISTFPITDTVYLALDTITNYNSSEGLDSSVAKEVKLEVRTPLEDKLDITTKVENLENFDLANVIIQAGKKILKGEASLETGEYIKADLYLFYGDAQQVSAVNEDTTVFMPGSGDISKTTLILK